MSKVAGVLVGLLGPAFLLAAVVAAPAIAQEKKAETKVQKAAGKPTIREILQNDKVRVVEVTYKPGDESASVERPARVVRALRGGTLSRIYPDGKKEASTYKNGEVRYIDKTPAYVIKNDTKNVIHLYVVFLK